MTERFFKNIFHSVRNKKLSKNNSYFAENKIDWVKAGRFQLEKNRNRPHMTLQSKGENRIRKKDHIV